MQSTPAFAGSVNVVADPDSVTLKHRIVVFKLEKQTFFQVSTVSKISSRSGVVIFLATP
jgi:hypothetical protein